MTKPPIAATLCSACVKGRHFICSASISTYSLLQLWKSHFTPRYGITYIQARRAYIDLAPAALDCSNFQNGHGQRCEG